MKNQAGWTKPINFALITVFGMTLTVGVHTLAAQESSSPPQKIQKPYQPMARSGPSQYQPLYPEDRQQQQTGMQNQQNQRRYYSQQDRQFQDQQQSQYQPLYPEDRQQMGMQQGRQDQQAQRRYYSQSQQDQQGRQQMGMQQGQQDQQAQRRYYSQSQQDQQGRQQTGSAQWQLDPMGWVNLGYDYNNDGIFDAFELITVYDLQKMKASQKAGNQMRQQGGQKMARQDQRQRNMVQGTIVSTKTVQMANSGQQHLIAKVKNQYGTANIDLGPQQNLSNISLQQGDDIKVFGVEGSINDNFILLADRVQVNGQRAKINRQDSRPLKKFQATVLNTRSVSKDQHTNVMARLELQDGSRTIANFGPKAQLPEISQGQQVQLLARVTEIGGKRALIADRLRTQGETYRIDWDKVQKGSQQ